MIDSEATPDKNSLTTGTLMMKDIENKASYEDSYRGIGYTYDRKYETIMGKAKDHLPISDEERTYVNDRYNRMGLVPDLGMPSSDSVTSTTKSAIAPGKLTVTKEPVNRNTVNRNTKNALNELGKIFDKKKLEERQELAKLFAKNANEAIHKMSESKGWEDGSKEKIALHTLVSGITAQLGGQPFADGAIAGGINEAVVGKLMDTIGKDNPDMVQIASAVLGYATNKLAGKDGETGGAVAQWGTKWNENIQYSGWDDRYNNRQLTADEERMAREVWNNLSDEAKEEALKTVAKGGTLKTLSVFANETAKFVPEMVEKYPGAFAGVKTLSKVNTLVSIVTTYATVVEYRKKGIPRNEEELRISLENEPED